MWAALAWLLVSVIGFGVALVASRRVATHATSLAQSTRLSPFVVGLVVLAVGTDIPEIVNSVITSYSGHGDLNVGDSIGSTLTQMTLVLGLLPFLAGALVVSRRAVVMIGALTTFAVLVGVVLVGDGRLSRVDAAALVIGWVVAIAVLQRAHAWPDIDSPEPVAGPRVRHAIGTLAYLAVVAGGAVAAVAGMVELAAILDVPEYIVSFFGASIGTSLPELIVDVTAIRRGAPELALGDVLGSSLVDSTLSIGIGPLAFPTEVDATVAVEGGLYAAVAVALAAMLLGTTGRHNRVSGVVLVVMYVAGYVVLLR